MTHGKCGYVSRDEVRQDPVEKLRTSHLLCFSRRTFFRRSIVICGMDSTSCFGSVVFGIPKTTSGDYNNPLPNFMDDRENMTHKAVLPWRMRDRLTTRIFRSTPSRSGRMVSRPQRSGLVAAAQTGDWQIPQEGAELIRAKWATAVF